MQRTVNGMTNAEIVITLLVFGLIFYNAALAGRIDYLENAERILWKNIIDKDAEISRVWRRIEMLENGEEQE